MTRILSVGGAFAMLSTVLLAAVSGQGGTPAAPKPLVPVATNAIASNPEAFVGQMVSVTAAVDRLLSPTSFTIDQDPKASGSGDVLVIAPALNAELMINTYVTVIGEVVRADGRAAIRATSVITTGGIDIAKRLPPPMTAEEAVLDAAMKRIGPAFNALRQAVANAAGETAAEHATVLSKEFAETEAFWKKRGQTDALKWAADARAQSLALEVAVRAGKWDDAKAAAGALQQACSACHGTHRERLDDGTYRIRMSSAQEQ